MKTELLWSKALEVNKKAIECGAVIPLKTRKYIPKDQIDDYELRFLESNLPEYLLEYGPRKNPFIPWDSRLEIDLISDHHVLILNKYPVQLGHMLLLTKEWKPQSGWLNIDDFNAIITVESDTKGLWFFNSHKEAGASQPHRHIQLLRRDENELICPRLKWFNSKLYNPTDSQSRLSNSISIKSRNNNNKNSNYELYQAYIELCFEMDIGNSINDKAPTVPYNLLITENWIALIRRSKDNSLGFSINALGFAGYFLGTKNSDIKKLITYGPECILNNVVDPL